MSVPAVLIERTSRRVLRHRQLNDLGFFLPLGIAGGVLCRVGLTAFSLPATFALIPLAICGGFLAFALWRTQKKVVEQTTVAALLDEKTGGQERFLTLATCPQTQANLPFLTLVDQQAARQAASFKPTRDVSFKLDKRVPLAVLTATLSVLLLFFIPLTPTASGPGAMLTPDTVVDLEAIARQLMTKGTTPQEQTTGAQLLALAQELQDPAISPQEKRRLIDDAQQRMKLNLPLPQILPFDLKLFASESKEDKGQGNQGDQPQPENKPLAKADQNLEQLKKTLSAAAGSEPQPGPQKEGEQQKQPRQDGGGIKFDMPQPQSGKQQKQTGQEPSGQQQSSQAQTPNNQDQGTDPNRPGGQKDQNRGQEQGPKQNPSQTDPQEKGRGSTIGGSPGERFLQPGEQPGGFLTKDARFVKVRIPVGEEAQGENEKRTENRGPARPKVPYSNAPLKEGPPDQAQPKQPIPLEYRKILQ